MMYAAHVPKKSAARTVLRKRSFDAVARLYDRTRPGYPEPLFDDVARLSRIPKGGRILEIGPGTGQATLPLARRGFTILGLELGASMARVCRRNLRQFPKVEIRNTAFEDWEPAENGDCTAPLVPTVPRARSTQALRGTVPGFLQDSVADAPKTFDLVLAATAFHWIPYKTAYPRCAKALKATGSLALLWNFVEIPDTEFFNNLRAIYHRIAPHMRLSLPPELRIERQRKKIVNSGLFGPVTICRHPWQKEYSADDYIGLLKTMSDHAILAPAIRNPLFRAIRRLINDNGGTFIRPVVAVLFLAPKRTHR